MSERFSIREQYEEVELRYLEARNQLNDLERRGKIPADQIPSKHRRLQKLRVARETLFRLAQEANDGVAITPPQDFESAA